METETDRRKFLASTIGVGSMLASSATQGQSQPTTATPPPAVRHAPAPIASAPLDVVRVGMVGMGDRGTYLLQILLSIEGVQIRAVCDPVESKVARSQRLVEERHLPKPEGYSHSSTDYRQLCARSDLDLVINATPWTLHTPVCLAALGAGKHVATEPPAAPTVDACWQQVEAAEKANKHCMLLENFCYQRDVLMVWNLVRRGLFGELMHAEGGYQKDARDVDLRHGSDGSLAWQGQFREHRMGNVFPTHDVGPISQWLDIHHGDRFDYLVSMGGNARALNEYGAQYLGPDHPLTTTRFDMSDINLCLLRTVKGRTVYLISDSLLSRPQPRSLYRLMGSKGLFDRTLEKLYLEGKSPRRDRWHGDWEPVSKYYLDFDHPLWRDLRDRALGSGFGGADYLCLERVIKALRSGTKPDIDVYDAAAWSSIVDLSEQSARGRSRPVDFPDFTRGGWKKTKPSPLAG
jgi:predicted dehydrogenase